MNSRTIQNEIGTWLATWHSIENTPPMEERKWSCRECFRKWNDLLSQIPPAAWIDWNEVAKKIGPEQAEKAYRITQCRHISCWERVEDVWEIPLKAEVHCKHCGIRLNTAIEALVEVY